MSWKFERMATIFIIIFSRYQRRIGLHKTPYTMVMVQEQEVLQFFHILATYGLFEGISTNSTPPPPFFFPKS